MLVVERREIIGGATFLNDLAGNASSPSAIYILRPKDGSIMQILRPSGGGTIEGSVSIGRLLGPNGDLYLVVPVNADPNDARQVYPGGLQVFRFNPVTKLFDSRPAWQFFARDDGPMGVPNGVPDPVFSTPCLADVDNDGILEIFFGSWDRWIYLIKPNADGLGYTKLWDYENKDTIWSSGAAADVNGDGYLELIIGADITYNSVTKEELDGGYLLCFDRFGKRLWRNSYPEAIYSSPAIGDIDGDGKLEVVVGTSDSWGLKYKTLRGNFVVCCDAATGQEKWRTPTNGHGFSSPAIGDVLGKKNPRTGLPTLQVVATSLVYNDMAPGYTDYTNPSQLYLIDADGSVVWARRPQDYMGKTAFLRGSPLIVNYDYNADGAPEPMILVPVFWDVAAFTASGDQVNVYHTDYSLFATPVVGDADGDGKLEMYAACSRAKNQDSGWVWRFDLVNQRKAAVAASGLQPWPMFRRTPDRTGRLLAASPARQTRAIVLSDGDTGVASFSLAAEMLDGSTSQFDLEMIGAPPWASVAKLESMVGATQSEVILVSIDRGVAAQSGGSSFTIRLTPRNGGVVSPDQVTVDVKVVANRTFIGSVMNGQSL